MPLSPRIGRISRGAALTLAGLALIAVGVALVVATRGRWLPLRTLLGEADGAILVAVAVLGAGLLAFVAGLVLFVFVPTRTREGAAASYHRLPTILAMLAIASVPANVVTAIVLAATGGIGQASSPSLVVLLASIVPLEAGLFLVLYLRLVRPGVLTWRELGLSADRLWSRTAIGAGSYLLVLVAVAGINYLLQGAGVQQTQTQTYEGVRSTTPLGLLAMVLAGGVLAPIAEESFFRGYAFAAFRQTHGRLLAYPLSAGLFAVAHFNLPALPAIFAVGLLFALLYDLTKSLVPGMVAHGLNNSFAFLALYLASSVLQR